MWGVWKKHNLGMVAKFRLKLKEVGKTTRTFRYHLRLGENNKLKVCDKLNLRSIG